MEELWVRWWTSVTSCGSTGGIVGVDFNYCCDIDIEGRRQINYIIVITCKKVFLSLHC